MPTAGDIEAVLPATAAETSADSDAATTSPPGARGGRLLVTDEELAIAEQPSGSDDATALPGAVVPLPLASGKESQLLPAQPVVAHTAASASPSDVNHPTASVSVPVRRTRGPSSGGEPAPGSGGVRAWLKKAHNYSARLIITADATVKDKRRAVALVLPMQWLLMACLTASLMLLRDDDERRTYTVVLVVVWAVAVTVALLLVGERVRYCGCLHEADASQDEAGGMPHHPHTADTRLSQLSRTSTAVSRAADAAARDKLRAAKRNLRSLWCVVLATLVVLFLVPATIMANSVGQLTARGGGYLFVLVLWLMGWGYAWLYQHAITPIDPLAVMDQVPPNKEFQMRKYNMVYEGFLLCGFSFFPAVPWKKSGIDNAVIDVFSIGMFDFGADLHYVSLFGACGFVIFAFVALHYVRKHADPEQILMAMDILFDGMSFPIYRQLLSVFACTRGSARQETRAGVSGGANKTYTTQRICANNVPYDSSCMDSRPHVECLSSLHFWHVLASFCFLVPYYLRGVRLRTESQALTSTIVIDGVFEMAAFQFQFVLAVIATAFGDCFPWMMVVGVQLNVVVLLAIVCRRQFSNTIELTAIRVTGLALAGINGAIAAYVATLYSPPSCATFMDVYNLSTLVDRMLVPPILDDPDIIEPKQTYLAFVALLVGNSVGILLGWLWYKRKRLKISQEIKNNLEKYLAMQDEAGEMTNTEKAARQMLFVKDFVDPSSRNPVRGMGSTDGSRSKQDLQVLRERELMQLFESFGTVTTWPTVVIRHDAADLDTSWALVTMSNAEEAEEAYQDFKQRARRAQRINSGPSLAVMRFNQQKAETSAVREERAEKKKGEMLEVQKDTICRAVLATRVDYPVVRQRLIAEIGRTGTKDSFWAKSRDKLDILRHKKGDEGLTVTAKQKQQAIVGNFVVWVSEEQDGSGQACDDASTALSKSLSSDGKQIEELTLDLLLFEDTSITRQLSTHVIDFLGVNVKKVGGNRLMRALEAVARAWSQPDRGTSCCECLLGGPDDTFAPGRRVRIRFASTEGSLVTSRNLKTSRNWQTGTRGLHRDHLCVEKTLAMLGQTRGVTELDITGAGYCLEDLMLEQGGREVDDETCSRDASWLSTLAHPFQGTRQEAPLTTETTELETLTIDFMNIAGKQPVVIRPFSTIYREVCDLLSSCLTLRLVFRGPCHWGDPRQKKTQEVASRDLQNCSVKRLAAARSEATAKRSEAEAKAKSEWFIDICATDSGGAGFVKLLVGLIESILLESEPMKLEIAAERIQKAYRWHRAMKAQAGNAIVGGLVQQLSEQGGGTDQQPASWTRQEKLVALLHQIKPRKASATGNSDTIEQIQRQRKNMLGRFFCCWVDFSFGDTIQTLLGTNTKQKQLNCELNDFYFSSVDVRGKNLGNWHAAMLSAWVSHHGNIRSLCLRDNPGIVGQKVVESGISDRFSSDGHVGTWIRIVRRLQTCRSLSRLDLGRVGMGPAALHTLATYWISTLTTLRMNCNTLVEPTSEDGYEGWTQFVTSLARSKLTTLDVSDTGLDPRALALLANEPAVSETMNPCAKLCKIDLSRNKVVSTPLPGYNLEEPLSEYAEGSNQFDTSGLKAFLMSAEALTELNISHTGLGVLGAEALSYHLCDMHLLRIVHIAGNDIGCDGAALIAAQLHRTKVRKLIVGAKGDTTADYVTVNFNETESQKPLENQSQALEWDLSGKSLCPADIVLIAAALPSLPLYALNISSGEEEVTTGVAGNLAIAASLRYAKEKQMALKQLKQLTVDLGRIEKRRYNFASVRSVDADGLPTGDRAPIGIPADNFDLDVSARGLCARDLLVIAGWMASGLQEISSFDMSHNKTVLKEVHQDQEEWTLFLETLQLGEAVTTGTGTGTGTGMDTGEKDHSSARPTGLVSVKSFSENYCSYEHLEAWQDYRAKLLWSDTTYLHSLSKHAWWKLCKSIHDTQWQYIKSLSLMDTGLTNWHLNLLASGLSEQSLCLQLINLSQNAQLAEGPSDNPCGLRAALNTVMTVDELNVSSCGLQQRSMLEISRHLPKMQKLNIFDNYLDIAGANAIATACKQQQRQQSKFHSIVLGHPIIVQQQLHKDPVLDEISNSDEDSTETGSFCLQFWPPGTNPRDLSERRLEIASKGVTDADAIIVAAALHDFPLDPDQKAGFYVLDISDNAIGRVGKLAIAQEISRLDLDKLTFDCGHNNNIFQLNGKPGPTPPPRPRNKGRAAPDRSAQSQAATGRKKWEIIDCSEDNVDGLLPEDLHLIASWIRSPKCKATSVVLRGNACMHTVQTVDSQDTVFRGWKLTEISEAWEDLCQAMQKSLPSLATLDLRNTFLVPHEWCLRPLQAVLAQSPNLQTVNISGNNFCDLPIYSTDSTYRGVEQVNAMAGMLVKALDLRRAQYFGSVDSEALVDAPLGPIQNLILDVGPIEDPCSCKLTTDVDQSAEQAEHYRVVVRPPLVEVSTNRITYDDSDHVGNRGNILADHDAVVLAAWLNAWKDSNLVKTLSMDLSMAHQLAASSRRTIRQAFCQVWRSSTETVSLVVTRDATHTHEQWKLGRSDSSVSTLIVVGGPFQETEKWEAHRAECAEDLAIATAAAASLTTLLVRFRSEPPEPFLKSIAAVEGDAIGWKLLFRACSDCPKLVEMDLADADLRNAEAEALAAALPQCAAISKLNVASNRRVGSAGGRALWDAIRCCNNLREFVVAKHSQVDPVSQSATHDTVRNGKKPTRKKMLRDSFKKKKTQQLLRVLKAAQGATSDIILPLTPEQTRRGLFAARELDLRSLDFGPGHAMLVACWLQLHTQWRKGRTDSTDSRPSKIQSIILVGNPLTGGQISGKRISDKYEDAAGLTELCTAFVQCATITHIDISECGLGVEAAKSLRDAPAGALLGGDVVGATSWLKVEDFKLEHLNISQNPGILPGEGSGAVRDALRGADIRRLQIDLGHGADNSSSPRPVTLESNWKELSCSQISLDTSPQFQPENIGPVDAMVLAGWVESREPRSTLTVLDLAGTSCISQNGSQSSEFKELCMATLESKIDKLAFANMGLCGDAVAGFTEFLATHRDNCDAANKKALKLLEIDLSGNPQIDTSNIMWRAMCKAFGSGVAKLNLAHCGISTERLDMLCQNGIADMINLRRISVFGNACADSTAIERLKEKVQGTLCKNIDEQDPSEKLFRANQKADLSHIGSKINTGLHKSTKASDLLRVTSVKEPSTAEPLAA
jgi:hypothetical protein